MVVAHINTVGTMESLPYVVRKSATSMWQVVTAVQNRRRTRVKAETDTVETSLEDPDVDSLEFGP